jgi:WD40 repeat protein
MPHSQLLDTLAQADMPELRHSLLSRRAVHWASSGPVLEAGSEVLGVSFTTNGCLVIAVTGSGCLRIWSTIDFTEVAQLSGHKGLIMSLAISSDGLRIVSGSFDSTLRLWDGRTYQELGIFEHEDEVHSVAFSPDSSLIVSGSSDCTVGIWNALSLEKITRLTGHTKQITSVVFFPDGTRIASGSLDCTVRMWDARTYESLPSLPCCGQVRAIDISPDSTRLVLGEHTSGSEGVLRVFDTVTLVEQAQVNISVGFYIPCAIAFSPDGDLIASGTTSGAVQVWDAGSLSNIATIRGHHGHITSVGFSPDASQIVSGSLDATVRIQSVASSEEPLTPIPGHDARVTQVVFSSDRSRLVSGSFDKTVRIWDGLDCAELAVLHGHEDAVWTVAYSLDGTQVVSGSRDRTVRLWNALNFQEVAVLKGHSGTVTYVTFAPNGTMIASCSFDHTVRLWSSSTLQELACLEGHTNRVWCVAFSPNGIWLVSMSQDETVRVWDTVNFTQVAELEVHHQHINSLFTTFSVDGKAILTRLWNDGMAWVCSDGDGSEISSSTFAMFDS